jgi:hypothetical protein
MFRVSARLADVSCVWGRKSEYYVLKTTPAERYLPVVSTPSTVPFQGDLPKSWYYISLRNSGTLFFKLKKLDPNRVFDNLVRRLSGVFYATVNLRLISMALCRSCSRNRRLLQ